MRGLRLNGSVAHRLLPIVAGTILLCLGSVSEAVWIVANTQVQSGADYDYRVIVKDITDPQNHVSLGTYDYTDDGQIWSDGGGWYYQWSVSEQIGPPGSGATVYCEVQYNYLGGSWTTQEYFYATWQ